MGVVCSVFKVKEEDDEGSCGGDKGGEKRTEG